jgi:deoxyribonuclease V
MAGVRRLAGGDAAYTAEGREIIAAWVVWDMAARKVIETAHVRRRVTFPYVPGLLSFREAPALAAAARKLRTRPDVFMIDGHGLAHPRRLGIASHLGLLLGRPTIGCAKSRLCGEHDDPPDRRGGAADLVHDGQAVGRVVRTREGVRPVYVSVGHLVRLDDAVRVVLASSVGYRLPEPARLAHQLVTQLREGRNDGATSGRVRPRRTRERREC